MDSESTLTTLHQAWEALNLIDIPAASKVALHYELQQSLDLGTYILAHGVMDPDCLRFAVDFTVGTRNIQTGTIAFHFNPRIRERCIVRNCLLKGYWGEEETASPTPFDLSVGKPFKLVFFVTAEEFMVSVNDRHFCSFRHRVPYKQITEIHFVGDIVISEVLTKSANIYPFLKDNIIQVYPIPENVMYDEDTNTVLPLPLLAKFKSDLQIGQKLLIHGKIKLLPHSFYINLQCGLDIYPHAVIPLHLNPRFSASCGSNALVRNCYNGETWMKEERAPGFPFMPGHKFKIMIGVEDDSFTVWVDDKLIAECPYKLRDKFDIDSLYIQGDIFLYHVSTTNMFD